ncbi:hypothetical protein DINM_021603 [Dirofilaria immitis]|nr:hypothetical protein [Dirofilaria immitis]
MYGFSSISWAPPKVSFSGGTPFSQCGREIVADVIRHHSRVGIPCLELLLDFLSSVQDVVQCVIPLHLCKMMTSNIIQSDGCIHMRSHFFQTLFGPLIGEARGRSPQRRHDRHRWSGNDRWPGSGGPGGPSRGGYGIGRRPIGRPTFSSGMSCPQWVVAAEVKISPVTV